MFNLSRSFKRRLVLFLFILSLLPLLAKIWTRNKQTNGFKNEKYSEDLKNLSSLDNLISYADEAYEKQKTSSAFDTAVYALNLSEIIKNRFYHGDLKYSFSENWIAWLAGKIIWSHISSCVLSNDILKHSGAMCSQQTSVFMEVLRKKGITVRHAGLGFDEGPGHYLCEVRYGTEWHLYDVSIEPDWSAIAESHKSLDYYLSRKELLYQAYEKRLPKPLFDKILERHSYGEVNKLPARNMKLLQQVMKISTYLIPLFLGLLLIALNRKIPSAKKQTTSVKKKKEDSLILVK